MHLTNGQHGFYIPSASRVVRATPTWRDVKGDFIRPFTAIRRRLFQNLQRTTRSAQPKQVATFLGMKAGSNGKGFENGTWFGLYNVLHHDLRTNLTCLEMVKAEPGPSSFWFPGFQKVQNNQNSTPGTKTHRLPRVIPYVIHFPMLLSNPKAILHPKDTTMTLLQVADPWTQPGLWDCCG